jgi:hypothetical protein
MDEQLDPSDQELIEDAIDPTPAAQKRLEGLAERIGLTFEEQRIFVLEFEAAIFEAQLSAVGTEFGFTPGQQAIFNAEFRRLRDDVSRRKKILALPSLKQRATDLDALRGPVEKIKKARAAFLDGPPGFLSSETHAWLLEGDAVAVELATLAKPSRYEILNRGHERPNGYREWLVGIRIAAIYKRVFDATLSVAKEGKSAKARRGNDFISRVLALLDEDGATEDTYKSLVGGARRKVRTSETRI